jgi:hypothetical protein
MKSDPINVLVLILVASFAIDRIVSGALFLLSFSKAWARRFPDAALLSESVERTYAEKKQKLMYFALAGLLGIVVLAGFGNVRLLAALGTQSKPNSVAAASQSTKTDSTTQPADSAGALPKPGVPFSVWLDILLTGLILMGGADRISQILKEHGAPGGEKPASRPIELTGKLVLEDAAGKRTIGASVGTPS